MTTLSLKVTEAIETQLRLAAQKLGSSKSEIVRRALLKYLAADGANNSGSFFDLAKDLSGSVEGPADLSTNKHYLKDHRKHGRQVIPTLMPADI